jgi:hypothetical protein
MCAAINNPANCEFRTVIRFLLARNNNAAEIHRQLCEVYRPNFMSDSKVIAMAPLIVPESKEVQASIFSHLMLQLELLNCCNNLDGKFLTTRPTAPISHQATTTYSCI